MHEQLRADLCSALYGARQESLMVAVSRTLPGGRGAVLYNSTVWAALEHQVHLLLLLFSPFSCSCSCCCSYSFSCRGW